MQVLAIPFFCNPVRAGKIGLSKKKIVLTKEREPFGSPFSITNFKIRDQRKKNILMVLLTEWFIADREHDFIFPSGETAVLLLSLRKVMNQPGS